MKVREADGTIRDLTPEEVSAREAEQTALLNEATQQQALNKLKELDAKSIRHIREHLASQVPALDDIEQEAVTERAKLPQKDRR